jgi:hypothetical protein
MPSLWEQKGGSVQLKERLLPAVRGIAYVGLGTSSGRLAVSRDRLPARDFDRARAVTWVF